MKYFRITSFGSWPMGIKSGKRSMNRTERSLAHSRQTLHLNRIPVFVKDLGGPRVDDQGHADSVRLEEVV